MLREEVCHRHQLLNHFFLNLHNRQGNFLYSITVTDVLHNAEPVTKLDAHVDCKIATIHFEIEPLSLLEALDKKYNKITCLSRFDFKTLKYVANSARCLLGSRLVKCLTNSMPW